jgi:hypothetical protein
MTAILTVYNVPDREAILRYYSRRHIRKNLAAPIEGAAQK